jgi:hypothetical protein
MRSLLRINNQILRGSGWRLHLLACSHTQKIWLCCWGPLIKCLQAVQKSLEFLIILLKSLVWYHRWDPALIGCACRIRILNGGDGRQTYKHFWILHGFVFMTIHRNLPNDSLRSLLVRRVYVLNSIVRLVGNITWCTWGHLAPSPFHDLRSKEYLLTPLGLGIILVG